MLTSSPLSRRLQSQTSGCLCPSNENPTEPDAPSEEEFLGQYDAAVVELKEEGTLVNIAGVSDIK